MSRDSSIPHFSRRGLIKTGLAAAVVPTAILAGASPASAVTAYPTIGTGADLVPTRRRTGWNGLIGVHPSNYTFQYDPAFHGLCNNWANTYGSIMRYMTAGGVRTTWFGATGVYNSGAASGSNHRTGNAFDLTAAYQSDGGYVDCNYSHLSSAGVVNNRRYAALAWATRKHCAEIGIVGSDSSHSNHIHVGRYKNGSSSLLLSHYGKSWDAWLVQYSCRAFMGVSIVLDGDWGNQTEGHYNTLMSRLGLARSGPFSSTTAVQDLAHTLCAKGVVGQAV